jgi:hypothetical protein
MKTHHLPIPEPCPADWDAMTGDEQRRFCASCAKHVHDLSSMTRREAERALDAEQASGDMCVRYAFDGEGTVQFRRRRVQPTAPPAQVSGALRLTAAAVSLLGLLGGSALFVSEADANPPPMPQVQQNPNTMIAGGIAIPPGFGHPGRPGRPGHPTLAPYKPAVPVRPAIAPIVPPPLPPVTVDIMGGPMLQHDSEYEGSSDPGTEAIEAQEREAAEQLAPYGIDLEEVEFEGSGALEGSAEGAALEEAACDADAEAEAEADAEGEEEAEGEIRNTTTTTEPWPHVVGRLPRR